MIQIPVEQLQKELKEQLGRGPMRFGPAHQECSVQVEIANRGLSNEQIKKFADIQAEWETAHMKVAQQKVLTSGQILRIVIFCAFDKRRSMNLMYSTDPQHFKLSAVELGGQLRTRTIFPCPGLKTREGYNTFYMRPSRYFPQETPTSLVIENLVYVLDKMILKDPEKGIAFLANMEGWTMSNFSIEYCRKFMYFLQGHAFPAKVELFLILNPPSWFGKVWAIMKSMMSPTFRRKVRIINNDDLLYYMDIDFEEYLPDEVRGGDVDTATLVRDFVVFHQALERALQQQADGTKNNPSTFFGRRCILGLADRKSKIPFHRLSCWGRNKPSEKVPCHLSKLTGPDEQPGSSDLTHGTNASLLGD